MTGVHTRNTVPDLDPAPERLAGRTRRLWSAGLGRREGDRSIVIAGIQSVRDKAAERGPVNAVIAFCGPIRAGARPRARGEWRHESETTEIR